MQEAYVEIPGARICYSDTRGAGECVVLSHPASQSSLAWEHQLPALTAAGYRVMAYSRRGFYRSVATNTQDRGTEVGDFVAVLDALGIDRAHIVGAAAGGGVAMRLAASHPGRLRSLVLAGSIVAPDEPDWRQLYDGLGIAAVKNHVSTAFIELGPSYRASNREGTRRFAELSVLARPDGEVRQPSGVELKWSAMEKTRIPTLLVTGEADLYAPPPLQRMIASHLPVHEVKTLREVGHAPYWETPAAFNAILLDFLGRQHT